jgi:diadenosine tetraphosphate (Ap4A) HIT family hydrolase
VKIKYNPENVFAKIIDGSISAKIVYQDDKVMAFHDAHPLAPVHVLVIPKGEFVDFSDFIKKASKEDVAHYFAKVNDIAENVLGLKDDGFRLCTNRGKKSGQSVFHFHTHIIGGSNFNGLFSESTND